MLLDLLTVPVAYAGTIDLVRKINRVLINPLILFLFVLGLVYFLYGVVEFLANQDNDEKRSTGKQHMLWGIVGMFIMVSVFAIMQLLLDTVGGDLPQGATLRG